LEDVEALDPEHLLLEGLDELLDDAVGLGLVVEGRAGIDAEVVGLGLVVARAPACATGQRPSRDDFVHSLREMRASPFATGLGLRASGVVQAASGGASRSSPSAERSSCGESLVTASRPSRRSGSSIAARLTVPVVTLRPNARRVATSG